MRKKILLTLVLTLLCTEVFSQRVRQDFYGDRGADQINSIIKTIDGKAVLVGSSFQGPTKEKDIFIRKIDRDGQVIPYLPLYIGAENDEEAYKVIATHDGGFLICGYTASEWSGHVSGEDAWLLKVNSFFDIEWYVLEGTSEADYFLDVFQNDNGSYFALGQKGNQAFLSVVDEYGNTMNSYLFPNNVFSKKLIKKREEGTFQILVETRRDKEILIERITFDSDLLLPLVRDTIMSNSSEMEFVDYCALSEDNYALLANKYAKTTGKDIYVKTVLKHTEKDTIFSGIGDDIGAFLRYSDFGDLIIGGKTYSTTRGAARSDAFLLRMDVKGNTVDTLKNKTALVWGKQQDDQLNCIEELTDGRLLVGGDSKQKSQEAWLSTVYSLKSYLDQKAFTKLLVNVLPQKDASNDDTLSIGEWSYIPLSVNHLAGLKVNDLRGVLKPIENTEGIYYPDTLFLGNLNRGDSTNYYLPFYGGENLTTGIVKLDFELIDNVGELITSLPVALAVKGHPQPRLKIIELVDTQKVFDIYARRDTIIKNYAVINVGEKIARQINCRHYLPYNTELLNTELQNLGDLLPNDTFLFSSSFLAKSFYSFEHVKSEVLVWSEQDAVITDRVSRSSLFSFYAPPQPRDPINIRGGGPPTPGLVPELLPSELQWKAPLPNVKGEGLDMLHHVDFFEFKIEYRKLSKEKITQNNFFLVRNDKDTFQLDDDSIIQKRVLNFSISDTALLQLTFKVSLMEGLNQFQLLLVKEDQIVKSKKVRLEYIPVKPKLHLLTIGVPTDLEYTVTDARDIAVALTDYDKTVFDRGSIEVKTKKEETSSNQLRTLPYQIMERLNAQRIDSLDWLFVYVSSHADLNPLNKLRIIGSDYIKGTRLESGSVDFDYEFVQVFKEYKQKTIVFLDVCKAGAVKQFAKKQLNSDPGILQKNSYIIKSLNVEENITYITSSGPNQSSYEDDNWGNGAFAYALKEALNMPDKAKLDKNGDQFITLEELFIYLSTRVPQLVKESGRSVLQQPMMIGSNHADLPLFRLK